MRQTFQVLQEFNEFKKSLNDFPDPNLQYLCENFDQAYSNAYRLFQQFRSLPLHAQSQNFISQRSDMEKRVQVAMQVRSSLENTIMRLQSTSHMQQPSPHKANLHGTRGGHYGMPDQGFYGSQPQMAHSIQDTHNYSHQQHDFYGSLYSQHPSAAHGISGQMPQSIQQTQSYMHGSGFYGSSQIPPSTARTT